MHFGGTLATTPIGQKYFKARRYQAKQCLMSLKSFVYCYRFKHIDTVATHEIDFPAGKVATTVMNLALISNRKHKVAN